MEKFKNTMVPFELEDGEKVNLTLAFYQLYLLKGKNKKIYDEYNRIMTKGANEELEMVTILYAAYLCANIENIDECMSEIDFLKRVSSDRQYVASIFKELTNPKKK